MLKNLKKVAAIVLSFAMAVQFGLADSYYVNAVEEPVEPQQQEETTTTSQEQEEAPTTEEEAPQQQEEQQQPAVEEEQPAPETKSVELSYVAEDGTVLHETASRDFNVDYSLKTDSSVMLNFDGYTLKDVIINNSQTVPADQANLSVTSDLVSVKFVYVSVNTKEDKQTSENNEQTKTEEASEDDAEADPETKEELPEYPAFDQSETAGNVVVHATAAEGVLPRDSKLVVKRITRKAILNAVEDTVSEKNKEMDSAVALDITIQNKDGVEIQPNGSVNISFENAAVSGDEINVYHVSDDASAVTEVATNTQSFDTNHFSIYVITGENEVPLTTFDFVANGESVSKQIVKSGDTLITPTAPDVAGKAFVGWYDGETKFEDFNKALTITETKTRTITAKYENALYVYFYNPDGTQIMRTEKVGDHETRNYSSVSYDVDSTHKLVGWAEEANGTKNIADKISVPAGQTSVNVYAIIKKGYWISFDSDGGSIVDSQFVLHGDNLVLDKSTTPTKPGYTFAGWYNGLSKVENGATVTNPMTLKAHWNAAEVNYTVIHWWENADDDGYSFHESENKTGKTGTEANAKAKSYDGFTAQPVTKKTIKGDGSTIVSVYYKRIVYDVKFYSYTTYDWRGRPVTPSKEYEDLRITAKYGQDISKKWPTMSGSSTWSTTDDDYNGPFQVNIATMPLGGAKFYGPKTGYGSETAYYYVEALPGEPSEVTKDGIQYKLDHKDTSPGTGYTVSKEDQYPLTGYTFNDNISTKTGKSYDNAKFYYTRNSYDLKFINNGKQDKTVTKKYEQSISSENYTPVRPSSLADYYEFDGWYDNELCEGDAFDFSGKKMPAQNVTLYAKWTAKKINLTYNLNNPEGDVVKGIKKVEAGTIANTVLPSATTTSDYSFAGWYYADGNGNITSDAYNTNEAITKDTSVIGKWLYNGELKVVYNPGTEGSKATVPTDSNIYAGGAKVTVAKNATTTSKKKFLGWKLKGNLYHPGDAFEVNKDLAKDDNVITLTAIWGNEESSTTMSYNPGNGRGSVQTVPVKNNESVTLRSEKDFGYQAPEKEGKEYYFAGWATSKDDANNGKATYAAGQTVHVDVNGENVLYATWIEKTVITLVAKSDTVTYNGEAQSIEGFKDVTDGYIVSGLTAKATGTNVGEYTTKIEGPATVKKGNEDVTEKVVVNVVPGKLTISRRNVTLTSASDEKVYDGNPLTNETVTAEGFVEGQGATYNVTGTITNVGEKANAFTYALNEGTKADNYNITKTEGTLKVTPVTDKVTVTITGNTGSEKYDGNSHKVTGYTSKFSNGLYTEANFKFSGKAEASRTDAGQTDMGLAAEQFTNTSANFTNVEFVVTDGYSKVNKRKVTLTSASDEKVYDGNALTKNKVTESVDGFAKGEGATYDVTGSQTNVGSSKNTFTYTLNEGTKADNYEITKSEGTLKVTPITNQVTVTITGNTSSVTYDGNSHEVTGYTTSFSNALYTANDFEFSGTAEASRTDAGQTSMGLAAEQFTNTSANFTNVEFVVIDGYSKVEKRTVTLTSASDEKVYDGNALTNGTVTAEGFVEGQGATYGVTGSQTDAGESKNTFTYTLNEGTNADNYEIKKAEGTLKVTPVTDKVTVTITGNTDSVKYDGNSHKVTGYTTSFSNDLYTANDFEFSGTAEVNGKDADTYKMGLKKDQFKNTSKNFTNVEFVVKDGQLVIGKRTVTLTSGSGSKIYNGKPLTNGEVTVTGDGFANGEGATYDVTGTITNVGETDNTFTYTLNEGTKAGNYEITKTEGKLIVTADASEVVVTITENSANITYDGNEHEATGYTTSITGGTDYKEEDFTFNGNASVKGTDAGTYNMELKPEDFQNTNDNYSKVTFVIVDGTLTISKRNVTLTSASDEKVYDGNALTNDTVTADGFVEGQGATYGVTGSQTDAGESKNTFTYTLNEGTNADNYEITKTEGKLKVTPVTDKVTVTITGNTSSVTYDGNSHEVTGYTTSFSNALYTANDFEFSGTAEASRTNAGKTEMGLTSKQFTNTSANFTNVEFVVTDGYSNVEKRTVTLTSASDEKVYDGHALTNETVIAEGFVEGQGATYDVTGTITNVGEKANAFTYALNEGTKAGNYNITKTEGTLKVTPVTDKVTVTITGNTGSEKYDGNSHKVTGYTSKFSNGLYTEANFKFSGKAEASRTDAGQTDMGLAAEQFTNTSANFTNVEFVVTDGYSKVNKRKVTLTSASDKKVYDGNALTNNKVTASVDGFAKGEGATYDVTGSQTETGSSKNTFTYTLNEGTKAENYNITPVEGTLEVTPVTDKVVVEINGKTKTVTYNGNTQEVEGYDVTKVSNTLYPEEAIHFEGAAKASRKDEGTSYMGLNVSQFSNTSANFTNVTFKVTDGWLKVNPKSITPDGPNTPEDKKTGIKVTKPSDTMYNGEEQKNKPTVKDTKTGAILKENVDYTLSYTAAVNAGTVEVTITGKGNYTGTAKKSYEITKRKVTMTSGSASKVYDKKALTKDEVTVSGDGFAKNEGATYNVTGSRTKVGTSENTFTYTLKEGTLASNYNIEVKFGDLIVTAQDGEVVVTITGHSDSVKYDGHEKTVSGYEVTITEGSTYKTDDFTFSGNAEVKGTEVGTYSMGLNADQFTNTNNNYTQVTFIVNDGTLTITPKSITPDGPNTPEEKKTGITATDPDDSIYNGEAHVNPLTVRDTKTGKDLVENKDYTLNYSDDVVNVGTVTVTVKGIGNYTGEFTKKYQITPREYTVTTDSANKTYDGNPLTAGGTVNNLVKDETVVFTITGKQTDVGTSDNTYELKFEGTAKAKNYTHGKDSIGKLKVTKKSIVPDGPDTPDEKKTGIKVTKPDDTMYNGKEQKNKPVVRDTKRDVKLVEDTDYTLSYTAAVNAGTVTVTITGIGNYEGTVNTSYEITPRKVTMTSADDTKVYDGNALTKNKVTESGNGFVEGEGATYDVTGSQTDVGFSNNTFSYKLNKGTLASNYTIETKEGRLEVTPFTDKVTVTITGEKDTAVYDGKTHSVEGYKVTNISNALYKKADVQFNGTAKAEGIEVGTYTMKLTPAQFENKSRNFANVEFVVNDGKLEITPKSINPEDEKTGIQVTKPEDTMYNGEEQKNKPTVEDTKTGATLVENVDYTLSYTAAVNAGIVEVTITGKGNYTGTAKTSYEITKRDVLLTSATDSKVYDKKPLMNGKVTESGSGFVKDEGATYNVTGSQTKKGSSKNEFTYTLKSNTKASNYTIEVVYGDLTVTAEDGEVVVVITGHKKSFEYDGHEKSVKGYDVSITKGSTYEVSDFAFNGNDEVKGTEANTYPMGLKVSDFTNINDNYNKVKFVVTDGSLTITPKSITPDGPNTPEEKKTGITATDPADSIYTGKAHVNPLTVRDTKTGKDLVENKDYTLTYSDDVVNVGTVTVTVKGIGNYTGEFTKKYQITPREYTVTTDSAEKPYDGTALIAGGHVNGLVEGETVNFKTTGSQTNAGTSDNTYELKFKGTAVETNYKHGKDSIGTLTVKKQSIDPGEDPDKPNPNYLGIEISNPSDEIYDGKEHKWSPTVVDKTGKELIVGTDYAVEYATSDFTNAGTINVTITGIGNYTGKVTRTYSITPREYTITTLDGTKVYDGRALTNFGLVDGIVYGETYSFKTTGSQTEVGTSDNTYEWKWNGTAKKSNYKLAKESIGKLTVKAKSIVPDGPDTPNEKKTGITVSEPSDSMYDGKEHKEVLTVTDTKTGKELVAGTDYSVTYSADLVNAGTVTIKVAGLGNYTGSFTKTYKITKRSVTLTSATVSKVYDGSALTNTSITVSGDGFVEGEGASYEVTGTQTEVGNSANSFEYKLNENTLASNYNITKVVGTLTITAAPAPVTPATPSTPSSTPSTTVRTPSAPQVTTPVETVEKETTPKAEPKKEEKVEEEYTPKASPQYYWALINLICAILTVLFGLLLLISKRHKSEDDDEEDDDETKQQTNDDDESKEQEKKRGLFTRVLAVLIAIVSVVFFLVTEDLSLSWTWTDQWTIWMVVIGLVQIVVFFVGRKWKNVDDDEDEEEAQQA